MDTRQFLHLSDPELEDLLLVTVEANRQIRVVYADEANLAAKARESYDTAYDERVLMADDEIVKEGLDPKKVTDKLRDAWVGKDPGFQELRYDCHVREARVKAMATQLNAIANELNSCMALMKDRSRERQFTNAEDTASRSERRKS